MERLVFYDSASGVTFLSLKFCRNRAKFLVKARRIFGIDISPVRIPTKGKLEFFIETDDAVYYLSGFSLGYYGTGPTGFYQLLDCYIDLVKFEKDMGWRYKDTVGRFRAVELVLNKDSAKLRLSEDGKEFIEFDVTRYVRKPLDVYNRLRRL